MSWKMVMNCHGCLKFRSNPLLCVVQESPAQVGWSSLLVIQNVPHTANGSAEVQKLVRRFGTVIRSLVLHTMVNYSLMQSCFTVFVILSVLILWSNIFSICLGHLWNGDRSHGAVCLQTLPSLSMYHPEQPTAFFTQSWPQNWHTEQNHLCTPVRSQWPTLLIVTEVWKVWKCTYGNKEWRNSLILQNGPLPCPFAGHLMPVHIAWI